MQQQNTFPLGGRHYWVPVAERSILNDAAIRRLVESSGISSFDKAGGEGADEFAARAIDGLFATRGAYDLLGALLLPADVPAAGWTEEVGKDTADHLQAMLAPADKAFLRIVFARVLEHFFASGIASIWTSPTSSAVQAATGDPGQQSSPPSTPVAAAEHAEAHGQTTGA